MAVLYGIRGRLLEQCMRFQLPIANPQSFLVQVHDSLGLNHRGVIARHWEKKDLVITLSVSNSKFCIDRSAAT